MNELEDIAICMIKDGILSNVSGETQTSIYNMRKFHNWVKNQLIKHATTIIGKNTLLDLSVGRGGDLNKWKINGIERVIGIDIDKNAIFSSTRRGDKYDGAIARLKSMRIYKPNVKFYTLSVLDPNVLDKLNSLDNYLKYDIVSCQFALHYFSENNITLNHTFNLVSQKLNPNGIFIATFSSGDYIKNNLNKGPVKFGSLDIKKLSQNSYSFGLNSKNDDQSVNYFEIINESKEFFTMMDALVSVAKNNNLDILNIKDFYAWYKEYKQTNQFHKLDFQEMLISFLNVSIIMKKIN